MYLDAIRQSLRDRADCPAYAYRGAVWTHAELERAVSNLCRYLLETDLRGRPVAVCGGKQFWMKAAMLACSFAGAAYVPIDETTPPDRVRAILRQVEPALVIGNSPDPGFRTLTPAEAAAIAAREDAPPLGPARLRAEDVCYLIFTSGSSGAPKGVRVSCANVDTCVRWLEQLVGGDAGVILNQASFAFDLSVADFYLSLVTGSEHFILDRQTQGDYAGLFAALRASGATALVATPSFAELLLADRSFDRALLPCLRTILFCGERLSAATVSRLHARFDGLRVFNCYGPTECTFAVTAVRIDPEQAAGELPVGAPKPGVCIRIVDEALHPCPAGETGEILIAGDSVALGYLGHADPRFLRWEGLPAYRTGDLGLLRDGQLYCLGRKDRQIKYKGYRVELGDVERNICRLPGITRAVVLPQRAADGTVRRLFAFVTAEPSADLTPRAVQQRLKTLLPAYMCPAVRIVDCFPLTPNGKCDEKKLMEQI